MRLALSQPPTVNEPQRQLQIGLPCSLTLRCHLKSLVQSVCTIPAPPPLPCSSVHTLGSPAQKKSAHELRDAGGKASLGAPRRWRLLRPAAACEEARAGCTRGPQHLRSAISPPSASVHLSHQPGSFLRTETTFLSILYPLVLGTQ